MGRYLNPGCACGKAAALMALGAELIDEPPATMEDIPEGKAAICVVANGQFDAAAWAFCDSELQEFSAPDPRPRRWLLMDKAYVEEHAG